MIKEKLWKTFMILVSEHEGMAEEVIVLLDYKWQLHMDS
jgi:hypothetical protein